MPNNISEDGFKSVNRLNTTLPPQLARFVGEITGEEGLYETPSEFVRDLIRRYMEKLQYEEKREINQLLRQSISESDYSPLTDIDINDIRQSVED